MEEGFCRFSVININLYCLVFLLFSLSFDLILSSKGIKAEEWGTFLHSKNQVITKVLV